VSSLWMPEAAPPAVKFNHPGDTFTGTYIRAHVTDLTDPKTRRPLAWDDGSPKKQLVAAFTTREGDRTLYVKQPSNLLTAIRNAITSHDAGDLQAGDVLTIQYTGDGPVERAGLNPPKLYRAELHRDLA
jgi:hypothetical protein